MFLILFLLFLAVPIAELYVIVKTAGAFGIPETILALIVISAIGAALVRWQGASLLARMGATLTRGELPAKEVVDGVLILFAGALMLTPGFITDGVGLALLLPPIRIPVRTLLMRRFRGRVHTYTDMGGTGQAGMWTRWGNVYDARSQERPSAGDDRPELN